jgi:membrane protein YqaA with SNARE-associated domain
MIEFLSEYGYIGLFLGSMIAATLIPMSSDVQLVALLATGAEPVTAVAAAALGNWLGGMLGYGMGHLGKLSWLRMSEAKIERQRARIERWGAWLAFFTWLPLVGDVMAVGLGFYRIDLPRVAVFMLVGKTARYVVWAILYYWVV